MNACLEVLEMGAVFEASLGQLNETLLKRRQLPIFSKRISIPLLLPLSLGREVGATETVVSQAALEFTVRTS